MRQEVNLYTSDFFPKILLVSFGHLVIVSIIFMLLLLGYSYLKKENIIALEEQNMVLHNKSKDVEGGEDSLTLMDRVIEKKRSLESKLAGLEKQVERKRLIKSIYSRSDNVGVEKFYRIFLTVGEKSDRNLSIFELGSYAGGKEVLVNGYSLSRDGIPKYLESLNKSDAFVGSSFGFLKIDRMENSNIYRFLMSRKNSLSKYIEIESLDEDELKN